VFDVLPPRLVIGQFAKFFVQLVGPRDDRLLDQLRRHGSDCPARLPLHVVGQAGGGSGAPRRQAKPVVVERRQLGPRQSRRRRLSRRPSLARLARRILAGRLAGSLDVGWHHCVFVRDGAVELLSCEVGVREVGPFQAGAGGQFTMIAAAGPLAQLRRDLGICQKFFSRVLGSEKSGLAA
jgi:hypothetical protein